MVDLEYQFSRNIMINQLKLFSFLLTLLHVIVASTCNDCSVINVQGCFIRPFNNPQRQRRKMASLEERNSHDLLSSSHRYYQFLPRKTLNPNYFPRLFQQKLDSQSTTALQGEKDDEEEKHQDRYHFVDGITCREIDIDLPVVGRITILEATAESQDDLVNMALVLDDDDDYQDTEQKLKSGDPYGAVLWPAAWAVSNYLLTSDNLDKNGQSNKDTKEEKDNEEGKKLRPLQGLTILELGTGTGLVSIAAALGGAKTVKATDYEEIALQLTSYASKTFHAEVDAIIETSLLDMLDYKTPLPPADIVVAADIMYEPKTGIAMAHRAIEALQRGSRVIIGDSPGRPGRPAFLSKLKELGVSKAEFVDSVGWTCSGPRHELICGKGSTSVSETPEGLAVALLDLNPCVLGRGVASSR